MSGVRDYGLRGLQQFEGRDLLLLIRIVITTNGKGDITMITGAPGGIFFIYDNVMYLENAKCLGSCKVWFTDKTASAVKHVRQSFLGKNLAGKTYGSSAEARLF